MTSLIELIRSWCADRAPDADAITVRIYRNGHLITRAERRVHAPLGDRHNLGAFNAANAITGALLGAARRAAKMECRNRVEVR